jgi:hypothetical protein
MVTQVYEYIKLYTLTGWLFGMGIAQWGCKKTLQLCGKVNDPNQVSLCKSCAPSTIAHQINHWFPTHALHWSPHAQHP